MGIRINQNVMAMNAYRNLTTTEGQLSRSLERLSSGFRINRAADDAAGLVISEGLRAQVNGLKMATRNAQDGVSVVQTAEGALTETHAILQRMRELAVQAASSGSSDQPSRDAAQVEVAQLQEELDRIANTTKFGDQVLLNGNYGGTGSAASVEAPAVTPATWQQDFTGAAAGRFGISVDGGGLVIVDIDDDLSAGVPTAATVQTAINTELAAAGVANVTAAVDNSSGNYEISFTRTGPLAAGQSVELVEIDNDIWSAFGFADNVVSDDVNLGGGVFQVGSGTTGDDKIRITIDSMTAVDLGVDVANVDVSTADETAANLNITRIDAAITDVSTLRGNLGAYQNRFERTISNLSVTTENLSASESRIRDTDMAAEMMSFTRAQILQQAGTAMLAQANAVPQSVLQLLQ